MKHQWPLRSYKILTRLLRGCGTCGSADGCFECNNNHKCRGSKCKLWKEMSSSQQRQINQRTNHRFICPDANRRAVLPYPASNCKRKKFKIRTEKVCRDENPHSSYPCVQHRQKQQLCTPSMHPGCKRQMSPACFFPVDQTHLP